MKIIAKKLSPEKIKKIVGEVYYGKDGDILSHYVSFQIVPSGDLINFDVIIEVINEEAALDMISVKLSSHNIWGVDCFEILE